MELDSVAIKKILPHRYPFQMVDKILEVEPGVSAVGIKAVTSTEPHFQGHFPDIPIMPGVLIVEAMAQVGAVCGLLMPEYEGAITFFGGIENMKFKQPVVPGDVMRIEMNVLKMKMGIFKFSATATVDGKEVASGVMNAALRKVEK